jgi:hypothetical protein
VLAQDRDQLRSQGDIAIGGLGLGRNPPGRHASVSTRELSPEVQFAGGEVEVAPDQAQQLGDAKAGVGAVAISGR